MGILAIVFSQKNIITPKKTDVSKAKVFSVKTPEKNKPKDTKLKVSQKILDKPKPKINSTIEQMPNFYGKSFSGQGGDSSLQVSSSGASFSEQLQQTETAKEAPARILKFTEPKYPHAAKSKSIEGHIRILLYITESGTLENYDILESHPQGIFDSTVKESLNDWTFKAAISKGKAAPGKISKKIYFKLDQI